ncbi:MAG: MaoC family dehydratase [Dehalococcoidales bacterium]
MAENSPITDEFKDKLGVERELGVYEVEKGMIRRFAQAIDDPNPLWQDEEYAKQSQYGGIIAPPTFIVAIGGEQFGQLLTQIFPKGLLHGSTELECYQPTRPGDKIAVTVRIANIRERLGRRSGKMTFVTFDLSYRNQRGKLVAKCQQTMIGYETERAKYG